jgi:hypothetical protein
MNRKPLIFLLWAAVLCFAVPCGSAEIYIWTDPDGVKHYSDQPPAKAVPDFTTREKIVNEDTYYEGRDDAEYWEGVIQEHKEREAAGKIENQRLREAEASEKAGIRDQEIKKVTAEIEELQKTLRYQQKSGQSTYAQSTRRKLARAKSRLEGLQGNSK